MATMSDKVAEISDPTHHTSLMNTLRAFITTESFIDVQFICQGGHKVYAHKLMLISVSGLLKKVLIENPDSNEMITIHLPDISSKLLRIVITFLYIGYMRLSSAEMDQFKMVLGLLDIEIFQKIRDQENSANSAESDPLATSNNQSSSNTVASASKKPESSFFESSNVSAPSAVNVGSVPIGRRICPPQGVLSAEYGAVAQSSTVAHVTSVPVDSGPQYITIRTDQLGIPNNCGEVMLSYSAVPVHHTSSGMVVQHNAQRVTTGQAVLQDQNQYNTLTSNVINGPVTATHVTNNSGISSNVSINNIGQLSSSQVNVQHVSPLSVQAGGQQIVRLVPAAQVQQSIVSSNSSFSNSQPERAPPVSANHLNNKGVKRKSSSSFSRPSIQTSSSSQDIVIDLSDDDPEDPLKPVNVTGSNRQRVKSRKSVHSSSSAASSSSQSSSSLNVQSVHRNSAATPSSRVKQKNDSKDIIEVTLTDSKSSVNSNSFNKF